MQFTRIIFSLTLALVVAANCQAQDDASPKAKKAAADNGHGQPMDVDKKATELLGSLVKGHSGRGGGGAVRKLLSMFG